MGLLDSLGSFLAYAGPNIVQNIQQQRQYQNSLQQQQTENQLKQQGIDVERQRYQAELTAPARAEALKAALELDSGRGDYQKNLSKQVNRGYITQDQADSSMAEYERRTKAYRDFGTGAVTDTSSLDFHQPTATDQNNPNGHTAPITVAKTPAAGQPGVVTTPSPTDTVAQPLTTPAAPPGPAGLTPIPGVPVHQDVSAALGTALGAVGGPVMGAMGQQMGISAPTLPTPQPTATMKPKTMADADKINWQDQDSVDRLRSSAGLPPKAKVIGDKESYSSPSSTSKTSTNLEHEPVGQGGIPLVSPPPVGTYSKDPIVTGISEGDQRVNGMTPEQQEAAFKAKYPYGTPLPAPSPSNTNIAKMNQNEPDMLSALGVIPSTLSKSPDNPVTVTTPNFAGDPVSQETKRISQTATGPLAQAVKDYAQKTGGRDYVKDLVIRYASSPEAAKEPILKEADSYGLRNTVQTLASSYKTQAPGMESNGSLASV